MQHRFHLTRIGALQAEIREQHDHAECSHTVVPAQAGTHIPETVVMGPRLRGDDRLKLAPRGEQRSRGAAKVDERYGALLPALSACRRRLHRRLVESGKPTASPRRSPEAQLNPKRS